MGHRGIAAASALLLGVMLWPAVNPTEIDSLPVSNYPMFAHRRDRVSRFHVAVLIDRDGVEHRLDPGQVGGTDQPVQAAMTVVQSIRNGTSDDLCAEIAAGLEQAGTVEVASVDYDTIAWFRGDHQPLDRTVHARCPAGSAQ